MQLMSAHTGGLSTGRTQVGIQHLGVLVPKAIIGLGLPAIGGNSKNNLKTGVIPSATAAATVSTTTPLLATVVGKIAIPIPLLNTLLSTSTSPLGSKGPLNSYSGEHTEGSGGKVPKVVIPDEDDDEVRVCVTVCIGCVCVCVCIVCYRGESVYRVL